MTSDSSDPRAGDPRGGLGGEPTGPGNRIGHPAGAFAPVSASFSGAAARTDPDPDPFPPTIPSGAAPTARLSPGHRAPDRERPEHPSADGAVIDDLAQDDRSTDGLSTGHLSPGHQASGRLSPGHQASGHLAPGHLAPGHLLPGPDGGPGWDGGSWDSGPGWDELPGLSGVPRPDGLPGPVLGPIGSGQDWRRAAQRRRWEPLALVALPLALIAPPVAPVVALVGLARIRRTRARGRGLALTALIASTVLILTVLIGLWLVLAGAPERSPSGTVTAAGDLRVTSLRAGDCLPGFIEGTTSMVRVVPCARPHLAEVFARFDLPAGDYPGQAATSDLAQAGCTQRVPAGLTRPEGGDLRLAVYYPRRWNWSLGDRAVVCLAVSEPTSAPVDPALSPAPAPGQGQGSAPSRRPEAASVSAAPIR